jgi:hypothetical protein
MNFLENIDVKSTGKPSTLAFNKKKINKIKIKEKKEEEEMIIYINQTSNKKDQIK